MATQHRVLCINKSDRSNIHERITHIGGKNSDGKRWKITQASAIDGIESKEWEFFVSVGGKNVLVIVATSRYGYKYIKTESDGDEPNNLLSLQECP